MKKEIALLVLLFLLSLGQRAQTITPKNNYNSFVVPIKNPEALAKATIKLLTNEKLRKKFEKNSIKTAEDWKWEKVADRMLKLFEKELKEGDKDEIFEEDIFGDVFDKRDTILKIQKPDKNEEAEHKCDTICIPYVRGPSDLLRKQLAKEGVNLIFNKGRTLRQFLFNGEPKKTDRRKRVCYRVPCLNCFFCYIGETSQLWDERESQHKRSIKNKDSNNSFFVHEREYPDHVIGWKQVTFLACDSRYSQRRMKESILIDIFSHKGVMNIEDGMKKDACWNVLLPLLRKNFLDL
jgi:hypothetical protein